MRNRLALLAVISISAFSAGSIALSQPFPDQVELRDLAAGEGFGVRGVRSNDQTGLRVAGIGDFNHDGLADVAVAANFADNNGVNTGSVYVLMGTPSQDLTNIDLEDLESFDGFRVDGLVAVDTLGDGISGAGDVNGDGIDDLILGASQADPGGPSRGVIYVLFGRSSFPKVLDLNVLDGTNGSWIEGIEDFDLAGSAISKAGDVNGDGIDDLLIGAWAADSSGFSTGEAYVVYGRSIWPPNLQLSQLDGENGFRMLGMAGRDETGKALAAGGDVNGDGLADFLVGAAGLDSNASSSGGAYLVFGRKQRLATIELSELDGSTGVRLLGDALFDQAGSSVGGAADINRDGLDDILVGAGGADGGGQVYLLYGRTNWIDPVELVQMEAGDGVTFSGASSEEPVGEAAAGAGDFNGDGLPDVVIGSRGADENGLSSGEAYVVFGSDSLPPEVDLADIGSLGVTFLGADESDQTGISVASAGDFNGDGIEDILIGSREDSEDPGYAHVVFGQFETGITLGATAPTCPGTVQLRSKGLVPNASIDIYRGSSRGSSTIQTGDCSGVELDLNDAQLVRNTFANDNGVWLLTVEIANPNICGIPMQLVDLSTCQVSNVTQVPFD